MRRYGLIAALAVTAALTVGCGGPADMTVHGIVRVPDNPVGGEDPPVQFGDQVTVTDPSGKVIGVGSLGDSNDQGRTFTLTFGFTVKVAEGSPLTAFTYPAWTGPRSSPRSRCSKDRRSARETPASNAPNLRKLKPWR